MRWFTLFCACVSGAAALGPLAMAEYPPYAVMFAMFWSYAAGFFLGRS